MDYMENKLMDDSVLCGMNWVISIFPMSFQGEILIYCVRLDSSWLKRKVRGKHRKVPKASINKEGRLAHISVPKYGCNSMQTISRSTNKQVTPFTRRMVTCLMFC